MSSVISRRVINVINKEVNEIYKQAIMDCSELFGFNVDEAIEKLGSNFNKSVEKKEKKEKKSEKKEKTEKSKVIPLPWMGVVNELYCNNIKFNHGLYTQCPGIKLENGFCKTCKEVSSEYFTVEERLSQGAEYKDSKNRKPVQYGKLLKKMEISVEEAQEEAGKNNIELNEEILKIVEAEKPKKEVKTPKEGKKGRPKNVKAEVTSNNENAMEDLFDKLVNESNANHEEAVNDVEVQSKEAEKEAKKKALEEAKAAKKAEIEAEKEAKKKALEEAKAAKKAEIEAEKEAKKKALEEAKAAKKALEEAKALKKVEAEAKKTEKKEPIKTEKKEPTKTEKKEPTKKEEEVEIQKVEVEIQKVEVKRKIIQGNEYLWDKNTKKIYDVITKKEIGTYDRDKNELKLEEEDEIETEAEESEDEYDEYDE